LSQGAVYLYMRPWLIALSLFACACSEAPTGTQTKAPEKPPEPITGRQAFQYTYGSARLWATDSQPLLVRSTNLDQVNQEDGKAGAWEIDYVSAQLGRARTYTWSAVDVGDTFHKGVTRGPEESWRGPQGQQRPFAADTIKIDTPEALETAVAKSADYLRKPGAKPRVNFLLEFTPRYPNPVWRVLWGASVGSAQKVVDIDASTGKFLGAT
jgi:hypothetical protein